MAGLKLSDLSADEVKPVETKSTGLKLSDLSSDEVKPVDNTEKQPENKDWMPSMPTWSGIKEAAIENLPAEGAMVGGLLGTPLDVVSGPGGTIGGAAAGGAAGAGLRKMIRDYQNAPSKQDYLTKPPTLEGVADSTKELGAGALEGATQEMGGQVLGAGLSAGIKKLIKPKSLEAAGSKLATSVVGGKPSKELTTEWVKEGEHFVPKQGSDVVKGLGKTAVEEGALPTFGGSNNIYDKTLEAVSKNEAKLNPLLQQAQESLGDDVASRLDQVGHVGDKLGTFMTDFEREIPTTSKREGLINKLYETYGPKLEEISNADGDLIKLNQLKQELQQSAKELNKGIYNNPNQMEAATEAQFTKQLGGIIRQHIEDLANSAGGGLGQEIKSTNKTLSNLYTYEDMARRSMDSPKGKPSLGIKNAAGAALGYAVGGPPLAIATGTAQYGLEKGMGQSFGQLGKILGSKALLKGAKAIQTPAGPLMQKAAGPVVNKAIGNPFSTENAESSSGTYADKISNSLYNATDDSLKAVALKLSQDPQLKHAAEELQKGIDLKDQQRKNNAIFLLLQKPSARKFLNPEE